MPPPKASSARLRCSPKRRGLRLPSSPCTIFSCPNQFLKLEQFVYSPPNASSSDYSKWPERILSDTLTMNWLVNHYNSLLIERVKLTRNCRFGAGRCASSSPCLV